MKEQDRLRIKADLMDLVEGTDLNWWECIKVDGTVYKIARPNFSLSMESYEPSTLIIDNKPVFRGDKLYDNSYANGRGFIYKYYDKNIGKIISKNEIEYSVSDVSWTPKERTVMIEVPLSAVEAYANISLCQYHDDDMAMILACKKAIECLKEN